MRWPLLLIAVLVGCETPTVEAPPNRPPSWNGPLRLANSEWELSKINDKPVLEGTRVTLSFEEKSGGGYSGCNWYGGDYTLADRKLQFKDITATAVGCLKPEGIKEQERDLFALLRNPLEVERGDHRLTLKDAAGKPVLEFRQIGSLGMDPAKLRGTRWQVPGSNATLILDGDDTFRGFGGCRDYRGTYRASGDKIRFPAITMNATECDQPLAVQRAEEELTTDLSQAERYIYFPESLDIMTVRGTHRRFVPATLRAAITGAPQLQPVDEGTKDPSFVAFRASLLAAVEKRDKDALLPLIADDIKTDFGGGGGRANFMKEPLWDELLAVVQQGGSFREGTFWAPYVYSAWPEDVDSFEYVVALRDDVIVRDGVTPIARLDHHIVRVAQGDPMRNGNRNPSRRKVVLPDKREGWVAADDVRSPIAHRAAFDKKNGVWKMTAFVAGD